MLTRPAVRYIIVGGLGTAIHLTILALCVEWFGIDAVMGSIIGFVGALLVSYVLNHYWTFRSRRSHLSSLYRYVTVSLFGLGLNTGMMYALIHILNIWYFAAQLSVILVVPLVNFLLNSYWTFSSKPNS